MTKKRTTCLILVACLLFSMVAFCIGSASGKVTSTGIEYNESRLHTIDDAVADAYIPSVNEQFIDSDDKGDSVGVSTPSHWWPINQNGISEGFVADSDANHGQVLKFTSTSEGHFGFEDFDVKQNRKYYIYFDAKSEKADAQAVSLIGLNGQGEKMSRLFLSGYEYRDTGVQYYINGQKVQSNNFKYTTEWQRYGVVVDTSNANLLADIARIYGNNFWNNAIHFQLGVQDATVYFDNMQLIEIQTIPDAVADVRSVQASVSVRLPKSAVENNGKYLSAGLRFLGSIDDSVKASADEIGFIITPSVVAVKDSAWYDISNGAKKDVRSASCYVKGEKDVLYSSGAGLSNYQVILTGLSTEDGKTSYIQRYSAAMYVRTGDVYTYYALGETSYNEVLAKYYVLNIKSGHINTGIELIVNGSVNKSSLTVGDTLPTLDAYTTSDLLKYPFLGWYDSTLTIKYTTVPNNVDKVYGIYQGYREYNFELGGIYDPNNKKLMQTVEDPFGGDGKVAFTQVIDKNDYINYGYYRGLAPTALEGVSDKGFDLKKGQTYNVSFYYRFDDSDPSDASASVSVYAVDPAGVHINGSKTDAISKTFITSSKLTKHNDWALCSFNVTNTSDYKHLFIRLVGGSQTTLHNLYIDNLVIHNVGVGGGFAESDSVKLIDNGVMEQASLNVGDALPSKSAIYDKYSDSYSEFEGWYDASLTTRYTTVADGVDTYYTKYKAYTKISFETNGLYDPNNKYTGATSLGISPWRRALDPINPNNICLKADLKGNTNNTHFAVPLIEGANVGYTLTKGNKYVVSFKYYFISSKVTDQEFSTRGAAEGNIGLANNKTDSLGTYTMSRSNVWQQAYMLLNTNKNNVENYPYLIFLSQLQNEENDLIIYIDDIEIREYDANENVVVKLFVENVTYNNNGVETEIENAYIGAPNLGAVDYNGANFKGWYNDTLTVPYSSVPSDNTTLYAKYDASIINFEVNGPYDPNKKQGQGISPFTLAEDPTDSSNTVLKVNLENNDNNTHFGIYKDGYNTTEGYKLTIGNTYTISYKYYIENLNGDAISVQFRGCKEANIGDFEGKSNPFGGTELKTEGQWSTVQTTVTYDGSNLTDEKNPVLIMLAQQSNDPTLCTATIYFDDIVIKETKAEKTYTRKTVYLGNTAIGSQYKFIITRDYEHNIVIPDYNFSYLAMMQIEELVDMLNKASTNSPKFNIVRESNWDPKNKQINIFVGNVAQNTIDTSLFTDDDYAIKFENGKASINAKSTYALALAIAEFGKAFENAENNAKLTGTVTGKYSEKINTYSSETFYRPTFLEDFNGTEINKDIWDECNVVDVSATLDGWKSMRSDEHTYVKDGNLIIEGAYNEEEKMFYGGMLRSHGKLEYRYGYIEVSCITPNGEGLWTACWLTPNSGCSGLYKSEIDINESFGNASQSHFNMHSWPTSAGTNLGVEKYSLDNRGFRKTASAASGKTFNDEYHTFGYFWTEDKGVFTVDGAVYFEYDFNKNDRYNNDIDAFNEKVSLIVSMTVANSSSQNQEPILGADYWTESNKYIVDYVHIYQIDGQELYISTPATE